MHFEVPKASSLKEFGGEYLMIVISILTALALEHGAQTLHHRTVAHEASEKIDAEIRANIEQIKAFRVYNQQQEDKLALIREALLADIHAKKSDEELKKRLLGDYRGAFALSIRTPTLRREAWDVAVANQAVSWMQADALKRYSVAYASMRDIQSISITGGNSFLDGPRMMDALSNAQMGVVDAHETYRLLNQIISSYQTINGNLATLQKELDDTAPADGLRAAQSGHGAGQAGK
ncbi:hypothetical protein [Massilia sp. TSP1-1-2]|uniref:hypothetical protein n=1 Tax=Massilia sp. TSP1-1-2 TaxID=2804649 RepID=UPI003CEBB9E4